MTHPNSNKEKTPTTTSETSHVKIKKEKNLKRIIHTNPTPESSKNPQIHREAQGKLRTNLNTHLKTKALSHDDTVLNDWEEEEKRIMNMILKKKLKNTRSREKTLPQSKAGTWNMDYKTKTPKNNTNQTNKYDVEMEDLEYKLSNIKLNIRKKK